VDYSRVKGLLTLGTVVQRSIDFVQQKKGRPKFEVEHCIAHLLGMRRLDLYLQFDRPLEETEVQKIRQAVVRLSKNEPLAYIQGVSHFYGHSFEVSPDVLIPRPETEILVTTVREYIEHSGASTGTIIDVCCGCGCIGLSLKALFPHWNVLFSDISSAAVDITLRNASKMQLNIEVYQGDLLEALQGTKADIIVSNPPYLSIEEYKQLDRSVKDFEPGLALVGGDSGLEIYTRLSKAIPSVLRTGGLYAVEIGMHQGARVSRLMSFCQEVRIIQDFAGRDRVVAGVFS
jgi:release factor glutamine methyltransferase